MTKISQRNEDLVKYNKIGIGLLIVIVVLIIAMNVSSAVTTNEDEYKLVRSTLYCRLDYNTKALLDNDWTFEFWSVPTSEGEGEFEKTYQPKIIKWTVYAENEGSGNTTLIAMQDYREGMDDYKVPYEHISFTYTFTADRFEKGSLVVKFRADLDIGNDTHSYPKRDMADFSVKLEGLITGTEFGYYIGVPTIIAVLGFSNLMIARWLNKHQLEEAHFFNTGWILTKVLFRKLIKWSILVYKKRQFRRGKVIIRPSLYQLQVESDMEWEGYDIFKQLKREKRPRKKITKKTEDKPKEKVKRSIISRLISAGVPNDK